MPSRRFFPCLPFWISPRCDVYLLAIQCEITSKVPLSLELEYDEDIDSYE